jgi:hypothetical protein
MRIIDARDPTREIGFGFDTRLYVHFNMPKYSKNINIFGNISSKHMIFANLNNKNASFLKCVYLVVF